MILSQIGAYPLKDLVQIGSNLLQSIPSLLLVAGGGYSGFRWVFNPLRKMVLNHTTKINFIYSELIPNGGNSIKDVVNDIKRSCNKTETWQRARLNFESEGYAEYDGNGRCIFINRALQKMMGASADDFKGNDWKNFIHHSNKQVVLDEWAICLSEKRNFKMSIKYITPDSKILCCLTESFAQVAPNGDLLGYISHIIEKPMTFCEVC